MKLRHALGAIMLDVSMIVAVPTVQATDTEALSTMPRGLPLKGIFSVPTLSTASGNSAKVVGSTNAISLGTQGVQITDAVKQAGATWSTTRNKIDLSKNFKTSMWLYFGNGGVQAGDGMAFVIQNSKASAITAGLTSLQAPGQTLGVWGLDNNVRADSAAVASMGIQKSWAIEFDEYANKSTSGGGNSSFDHSTQITGPHIASSYPGEASSYLPTTIAGDSKRHYYSLVHNGLINTPLSNGQWHHLTVQWQAPTGRGTTGTMTYTLNDKDADTGIPTTGISQTVPVDVQKLGLDASTIASTPVWWGFTGSTGTRFANNIVVFESMPGLLEAEADLSVTNVSQNKAVTDGSVVNGNDELAYNYTLKYNSGKTNWNLIRASLSQNKNVTFTSGKIEYADGSSEDLSESELGNPTTIDHKLEKSLGVANNTATLTLNGRVAKVATETNVDAVVQYFTGQNYVASVTTPAFTIEPVRNLTLSLDQGNATSVKPNGMVNLVGNLAADYAFANQDVTIHATLSNGTPIADFKMNGTHQDGNAAGMFNLDLLASQLTLGSNQVRFYATDSAGVKSNVVETTITLEGGLSFGMISPDVNFGHNQVPMNEKLLAAETDWVVDVNDSRASGAKWYVYATASQLNSDKHALKGGLVYINADGNRMNLTGSAALVAAGDSGSADTHHVGNEWRNQRGIFLDVYPGTYEGAYNGSIDWSLMDTPSV